MAHCCPTLHVADNSFTLFTASAGNSSTVEAACTSVASSEITIGFLVFYVVAQTSGGAREVINGSIRTNHFVVAPRAAGSHRLRVGRCRLRPDIRPGISFLCLQAEG